MNTPPDPAAPAGGEPRPQDEGARRAVGGALWFTFAKVYFMAAGYVVVFGLPRAFRQGLAAAGAAPDAAEAGAVALYGDFGIVNSAVSILNMILIDGIRFTVSKFVSADESNAASVRRAALALQALVGGGLTLGYLLAAPILAGDLFHRPELTQAFRLSAAIPASYTFYAVFRGYLNGRRMFVREALLDVSFSTIKPAAMLALAVLGYGVVGAMGGFAVAALAIALAGSLMARGGGSRAPVAAGDLLRYELAVIVFTALFYGLISCDFLLVGRLLVGEAGRQAAGDYYGQLNVARIAWQGTFAITVVIFPLVSKVVAEGDPERTRHYVSQALRFTLLIAGFLAMCFSANGHTVLPLLFPKGFGLDPTPLRIMAFANLALALFMVCTTAISGSGRPWTSVALVAATLGASALLNALAIPVWGLVGAATATLATVVAGAAAALVVVRRLFGAGIPAPSALRIAAVMGGAGLVAHLVELGPLAGKLGDLGECVALGLLYVAGIFAVRELRVSDLRTLRA